MTSAAGGTARRWSIPTSSMCLSFGAYLGCATIENLEVQDTSDCELHIGIHTPLVKNTSPHPMMGGIRRVRDAAIIEPAGSLEPAGPGLFAPHRSCPNNSATNKEFPR
jgi:hypothetical protein